MMPVEDVKAELARTAAYYDTLPGRSWRPLIDTTNDPIVAARRTKPFSSWQRSEDYYSEGMLIWLDVDSMTREQKDGDRSLEDYAPPFLRSNPSHEAMVPITYPHYPPPL